MSDTYVEDNDVGIQLPEQVPIPPGVAAATMPMQSQGNAAPQMDSIITDLIISKLGGRGVQGANAAPMPPPPPAVGAPSSPVARQALEPPMPPPRTGSANAAPIPPSLTPMPHARPSGAPISVPPPTTGSANAAPMAPTPQPPGPMVRPGSYADIAFNALRGAFTSGPNGGAPSGAGSANAAPVGPPIPPSAPPSAPRAAPPAAPPTGGNPYSAMVPEWIKNALKYSVGSGGRPDELGALKYSVGSGGRDEGEKPASGRGSANAHPGKSTTYPPKDTGATGDEFAARRQQQKIGPPQLESLPKGASSRYTQPYAKGGVREGEKRPMPKQKRQAPRASAAGSSSRGAPQQRRAGAAPQTARGGRSAYAQSLIDSMGPRGAGVTTYIEPGTGNEILTGNGVYQNLGKTSTGTQKPAFTKFFDR